MLKTPLFYTFIPLFFVFLFLNGTFKNQDSVSIALYQIFCLDGDREGNFVRIEAEIPSD